MKKLRFLTPIFGFILFFPLGMLNAQTAFYSFDFTAAEGFTDGPVVDFDPDGENWAPWTGGTSDVTFWFDTSGTGSLVIDPDSNAFQAIKYVGFGSELSGNAYYGELRIRLNYEVGASAVPNGGPTVLPFIAIRGLDDQSRSVGVGLRDIPAANVFNFFTNGSTLNNYVGEFSPSTIPGEELGLAIDEAGLWTDGLSDEILIRFSVVNTEGDLWVLTCDVYNWTTKKHFGTVTQEVTDGDGTFTSQTHFLELQDDRMERISGAVHVDYMAVHFAPLPDVETPVFWAGYEVDENGWVDTMDWMGMLNVSNDPWIWSQKMQAYLYVGGVMETGAWVYVPGN